MIQLQPRLRRKARALAMGSASLFATVASVGIASGADRAGSAVVADSALETAVSLTGDSVFGRSGKLRARFVSPGRESFAIPLLARLFGDSAVRRPGVYAVVDSALGRALHLITLVPFENKVEGRLGSYRVGFWPQERGRTRSADYANPDGFIVVTPENQDLQISEHFRLRDFLTHDQQSVWPKYLVLRESLVDKLELVIEDLESQGIRVERMRVMSGFRTPQYNARGVGKGGRASNSRHQYGDAADVFVDNDGNGRMDDLNRDGRIDSRDARVIVAAVERVERRYPDLAGGGGIYRATRAHGPFAHIDARGTRARWGRS